MTLPRRTHRWSPPITAFGAKTTTGCEQHERICVHCGLIKVTVLPPYGFPWREWRYPDNPSRQHRGAATPLCGVMADAEERRHPDLMERYCGRLSEALTVDEKVEVMRAALRETFRERYPMPEGCSWPSWPIPCEVAT